MLAEIHNILLENERRNKVIKAPFNPITGEGSILDREKVCISDFPLPEQYLPLSMLKVPLVKKIIKAGSIRKFITDALKCEYTESDKQKVIEQFIRVRIRHDFCFWAAMYCFIKQKGGGEDIHFRLNRPQRKLVECFERKRMANEPIRLILLKARQWGGSTATQLYMAWLQLVHQTGLNSLIVGHVKDASAEVKDMFDRMIKKYPTWLLHNLGEQYSDSEPKLEGVQGMQNIQRIPQRNCKIKIGTAESPDSARGGDYNLVHCTEVGLWKKTEGKKPEHIIRSACSGVLLKPYTMIVYESTANGTGNFFHREYSAAKDKKSQFEALFIAWYDIEQYSMPIANINTFATHLYQNRNNNNVNTTREQSGKYLWWLWEQGATLEAIEWYIHERMKCDDHGDMASEFPSDDVEAFVHSGARVFDKYKIEALKPSCRDPKYIGDIYADEDSGKGALKNIRFTEDKQGLFWVWSLPEIDSQEIIENRYLVIVDVGGRSKAADFSVILVLDRLFMMDGGKPSVVAQWYGHIDMDLLAWKAAQIASFYDDALLVIESNTIETHDKERSVDGDQSSYLLAEIKDVYDNLYARKQSEDDIINKVPRKLGFHTNVSTKPMIISTLVKVIREGMYVERDVRCLDEYLTYEKRPNGSFSAILGKHDDLLMTRAIGLHICFFEMDMPVIVPRTAIKVSKSRTEISAATI
jgi:hypothetical protein